MASGILPVNHCILILNLSGFVQYGKKEFLLTKPLSSLLPVRVVLKIEMLGNRALVIARVGRHNCFSCTNTLFFIDSVHKFKKIIFLLWI